MTHEQHDRVSLELARRIADDLPRRPEWLLLAERNLDRWTERNGESDGLVRCYAEWRQLLRRPLPDIVRVLTAADDESVRLRHNSPFVGIVSPREVWAIKRRVRDEAA